MEEEGLVLDLENGNFLTFFVLVDRFP